MEKEYDVIVVGTGPAGGTIAAKMAKAGKKVLMLERGAYHPPFLLGNQISTIWIQSSPDRYIGYQVEGSSKKN